MENTNQEVPEFIDDIKIDHYKAYFGDNFNYYSTLLLTQREKKSFNFNAFLLGGFWLLYHRLYKVFLALIVILIIETFIQDWIITSFGLSKSIDILINLFVTIIGAIILGKIADYYLIRHAQKSISSITSKYNDEDIIINNIRKAGSGNWIIFIILLLIILGAIILSALV